MNELALFAGAGGGILGGKLLGWRTVCAVERDAYAAQVLAQRQNDGTLEAFPIWSDVETFDGTKWRGIIDVVSGGFPCQDISAAGKGAGISGKRSRLWAEFGRVIGEVQPRFVFVENSPFIIRRGLETVLSDLNEMGFDAEWGCIGANAASVGGPQKRERFWLVAHSKRNDHGRPYRAGGRIGKQEEVKTNGARKNGYWPLEPALDRVVDGVALKLDKTHTSQLRCLGNGQVPRVAATAFELLRARLED